MVCDSYWRYFGIYMQQEGWNIRSCLMTSRTLRRRLHHGDVDGKRNEKYDASGFEGLSEPLLGGHEYSDRSSEVLRLIPFLFFSIWNDHFPLLYLNILGAYGFVFFVCIFPLAVFGSCLLCGFSCKRYAHLKRFGTMNGRNNSYTGLFCFLSWLRNGLNG